MNLLRVIPTFKGPHAASLSVWGSPTSSRFRSRKSTLSDYRIDGSELAGFTLAINAHGAAAMVTF